MRTVDTIVGGVAIVFGGFWLWQSRHLEFLDRVPGPGFLPLLLSGLIVLLGVLLVVSRRFGRGAFGQFERPSGRELLRAGAVGGVIVLATALVPVVGFVPALVLLVAGLLFGVERMRSWSAVATTLVVPLAAYWLFGRMFGVRLPTGPLGI